jgi:ATP-dependent Clp protease adapter protein ClpS
MMQRLSLLAVLLSLFLQGQAFIVTPPSLVRPVMSTSLYMGQAQPEVETKTKTTVKEKQKQKQQQKQKAKTDEPVNRRDEDFEDAPMFKLMLLGDESYDPEHVITRICAIMDDMDEDGASTAYKQAQAKGKAMCGKYPFERAELFKEQLLRSTPMIFADLEDEN